MWRFALIRKATSIKERLVQLIADRDAIALILMALFTLVCLRGVVSIGVIQLGDLYPIPAGVRELQLMLSAWDFRGFGGPNTNLLGNYILGLGTLILGAATTQKLWYASFFFVSLFSFEKFARPRVKDPWIRYTLVFSYGFSPIVLDYFLIGEPSFGILYALLPLFAIFIERMAVSGGPFSRQETLEFAILFAVATIWNPQSVVLILPFIGSGIVFRALNRGSLRTYSRTLLSYGASFAVSALLLAPYTLTLIASWVGNPRGATAGVFGKDWSGFLQTASISYGSVQSLAAFTFVSVFAVGLLSASLLVRSSTSTKWVLSYLLPAFGVLLLWSVALAPIVLNILFWVPGLFIFEYFWKLLAISFGLLTFATVHVADSLQKDLHAAPSTSPTRRQLPRTIMVLTFAALFVAQPFVYTVSYPFTNNIDFFAGSDFSNSQVPQAYTQAQDWLETHGVESNSYRTIWLPLNPTRYFIPWFLVTTYVPSAVQPADGLEIILRPLVDGETANFSAALSPLSVRYVLIDLTPYEYEEPWKSLASGGVQFVPWGQFQLPVGNVDAYLSLMENQSNLVAIGRVGNLAIFENPSYLPLVHAYSRLISVSTAPSFDCDLCFRDSFQQGGSGWSWPDGTPLTPQNASRAIGNVTVEFRAADESGERLLEATTFGSMKYLSSHYVAWSRPLPIVNSTYELTVDAEADGQFAFGSNPAVTVVAFDSSLTPIGNPGILSLPSMSFERTNFSIEFNPFEWVGGTRLPTWVRIELEPGASDIPNGTTVTRFYSVALSPFVSMRDSFPWAYATERLAPIPGYNLSNLLLVDGESHLEGMHPDVSLLFTDRCCNVSAAGWNTTTVISAPAFLTFTPGPNVTLGQDKRSPYSYATALAANASVKVLLGSARRGIYSLALETDGIPTITVGGTPVNPYCERGGTDLTWCVTPPLQAGAEPLYASIASPGVELRIFQLALVMSDVSNETLLSTLGNTTAATVAVSSWQDGRYQVQVAGGSRAYLVLNQQYDVGWEVTPNGLLASHSILEPFNRNIFTLNTTRGATTVYISYSPQAWRDLSSVVSVTSWVTVFVALWYSRKRYRKRGKDKRKKV